MSKILQEAFAQTAHLPEAEQDRLGRDILAHIEKLRGLREEIDKAFAPSMPGPGGNSISKR